jgi:hypothetical protein
MKGGLNDRGRVVKIQHRKRKILGFHSGFLRGDALSEGEGGAFYQAEPAQPQQ